MKFNNYKRVCFFHLLQFCKEDKRKRLSRVFETDNPNLLNNESDLLVPGKHLKNPFARNHIKLPI